MRTAIIENGYIANVILTAEDWLAPEGVLAMPEADAIAQGFTWVVQNSQPSLEDARAATAAILDALPLVDRMVSQPLRVQSEHALNLGQIDLAKYIVTNAVIPAHLEDTRTAILALFP